jgi:hypothetical protein
MCIVDIKGFIKREGKFALFIFGILTIPLFFKIILYFYGNTIFKFLNL